MKQITKLVAVGALILSTFGCTFMDWLQRNTTNVDLVSFADAGLNSCWQDAVQELRQQGTPPQIPFAFLVVNQVKNLNCSGYGITDVSDIEKAAGAVYMNLADNSISDLNVGYMPLLRVLDAKLNNLTTINVSSAPGLDNLDLSWNIYLTDVNLSNNNLLQDVDLSETLIENLDLGGMTSLKFLMLNDTGVSRLDLSTNTSLKVLSMLNVSITDVDFLSVLNALDSNGLCLAMVGHPGTSDSDCDNIDF